RRPDPAEPRLPSASPINFITTGQLITIVNIAVRCAFVNSPLRHVSRYSIRFFIVWHGAAGSFRHARTERQARGADGRRQWHRAGDGDPPGAGRLPGWDPRSRRGGGGGDRPPVQRAGAGLDGGYFRS